MSFIPGKKYTIKDSKREHLFIGKDKTEISVFENPERELWRCFSPKTMQLVKEKIIIRNTVYLIQNTRTLTYKLIVGYHSIYPDEKIINEKEICFEVEED